MQTYVIRRPGIAAGAAELDAALTRLRAFEEEEMPREVSWLHTYVVVESDGTLGTVCVYQAASDQALREHAARVGVPTDEILSVVGRVVYRGHP